MQDYPDDLMPSSPRFRAGQVYRSPYARMDFKLVERTSISVTRNDERVTVPAWYIVRDTPVGKRRARVSERFLERCQRILDVQPTPRELREMPDVKHAASGTYLTNKKGKTTMTNKAAVLKLQDTLASRRDDFKEGTVIRFQDGMFTYVALKAGNRWWLTGHFTSGITYTQIVDMLTKESVTKVEIVKAWTTVAETKIETEDE